MTYRKKKINFGGDPKYFRRERGAGIYGFHYSPESQVDSTRSIGLVTLRRALQPLPYGYIKPKFPSQDFSLSLRLLTLMRFSRRNS